MSDVSSVVNFFATANEGFSTTLGSTITSGATTVPLGGTSGLTDGSIFVGIIEPGATNQQVFTGTVDVAGVQITDVVWTRGSNVPHTEGATIVDYTTGTGFNMMSTGILKQHTQTGAHRNITNTGGLTTDTLTVSGASSLQNLTLSGTFSPANNTVLKAALEKLHYNCLVNSSNSGQVFGSTQVVANFSEADTTNGYGITADTTAHTLETTRAGLYDIQFRYRCTDVAATDFIAWIYISQDGGTTWYANRKDDQSISVGKTEAYSIEGIYLPANTLVQAQVYNGSGNTRFGYVNDGGTAAFWLRSMAYSLTVKEAR